MKAYSLKATVFVYTLFLISIALLMGLVILNLSIDIFNNNEYQNIIRKLSNDIVYKGGLAFKYSKLLNSNGSGYTDIISCPTSITMSGSTVSGTVGSSIVVGSGELICSGTYSGTGFQIFFNNYFTTFSGATFKGFSISFTGGTGSGTFADSDSTKMTFSFSGLAGIDNIDDNMNSDNYKVTSTGGVHYPSGGEDDDVLARKIIYFYIPPGVGYTNVFWSNTVYNKYIKDNTNNIDNVNIPLGNTSSGIIYLDVDKTFTLQVIRFNKASYTNYKELIPLQITKSNTMYGRLGYIQNNGTVSTGGLVKTGQEMVFDFINNDYAVFLSNTSTGTLFFNLKGYTTTGTGLYMNALNDTDSILNKFLGNDIIIDSDKRYLSNQFEVIDIK